MADLHCWVSGALNAMQRSPRFLNYTTDRSRRHQRLKIAEEIIIPALLRDRTRQTRSLSSFRTFDSDFATRVPAKIGCRQTLQIMFARDNTTD
jgi:hypothetical protein